MADINAFADGSTDESQKVNWRGDQVSVSQGGQSIYKSSAVPLARLGERKVVGDRVFRYAQLGTVAAVPGDLLQSNIAPSVPVTAGGTNPAGGFTFTFFHTASGAAIDLYAEGYVHCVSGTSGNMGLMYGIRTHALIATDTAGTLYLYDPLQKTLNVTDKWQCIKNQYSLVTQNTAGTAAPAGVLVCPATTNDYVWIQTYGPCSIKAATAAQASYPLYAAGTGAVTAFIATGTGGAVFAQIGISMTIPVASDRMAAFLTIAP